MIKKTLKSIFDSLGYHIINKTLLGNDLDDDLVAITDTSRKLVIFDIGANFGQAALELASHFQNSTIYSFEPHLETYADLVEKTKKHKNIKTYSLGFGDKSDKMELNISKSTDGNSLLPLSETVNQYAHGGGWAEKVGTSTVEITTMDLFCQENKIDRIDILKIDTQGYELKVIEGGVKVIRPEITKAIVVEVVFVEFYKQQAYFSDIFKVLTERGYKLLGFYHKVYNPSKPNYLQWCDAVFVCNDSK
jgi:FkbM family methyltransferase